MIQIRNTLYIASDNTYIQQDHEAIIIRKFVDDNESSMQRIPATAIEQIVLFGNSTLTTPFVKFCVDHNITISCVSYYGTYFGRTLGKTNGNILLRKRQYELYDNSEQRLKFVKNILLGKIKNNIKK